MDSRIILFSLLVGSMQAMGGSNSPDTQIPEKLISPQIVGSAESPPREEYNLWKGRFPCGQFFMVSIIKSIAEQKCQRKAK